MNSQNRFFWHLLATLLLTFSSICGVSAQTNQTKYGTGALQNDVSAEGGAFGVNASFSNTSSILNTATGFAAFAYNNTDKNQYS